MTTPDVAAIAAQERQDIAQWLRDEADAIDERAKSCTNAAQRERLWGQAFMDRFRAKQIIDGRHHMTQAEYQAKFRERLNEALNPKGETQHG